MRKDLKILASCGVFWVLAAGAVFAQEGSAGQNGILLSYERNFVRANLTIKSGVLRDAATDERAPEFIGQLYDFALAFCLQNVELLRDDPDMTALIALAAKGVGAVGYKASAETLWKLFNIYRDSSLTRVEILNALGNIGRGNAQILDSLNQFLANRNSSFRSGMKPDYLVLSAAINAIGNIGDKSSYPVLFTVLLLNYPSDGVPQAATAALDTIQGDYQQFLLDIIQKNAFSEKLTAFNLGMYNEKFSVSDRGNLAQAALSASVDVESDVAASELRFSAVRLLTELKWNRAADLAIKHFYRVQTDYSNGFATKDRFIEAIVCLGAMESSEAAQVLSIQLGLLNSKTEQSDSFDEAIILAVINALGNIGDKTAFDYLLYIGYLPYPDQIQRAAKEALARLKW